MNVAFDDGKQRRASVPVRPALTDGSGRLAGKCDPIRRRADAVDDEKAGEGERAGEHSEEKAAPPVKGSGEGWSFTASTPRKRRGRRGSVSQRSKRRRGACLREGQSRGSLPVHLLDFRPCHRGCGAGGGAVAFEAVG